MQPTTTTVVPVDSSPRLTIQSPTRVPTPARALRAPMQNDQRWTLAMPYGSMARSFCTQGRSMRKASRGKRATRMTAERPAQTWARTSMSAGRSGFDERDRGDRRHDAGHPEAGAVEQRGVLGLGALASADEEQHVQVEGLGEVRLVACRDDALDQEQRGVRGHVAAEVGQQG